MSRSIDRLTSLDRLMLGASRRWPQDIGALAILDGKILLDPAGELRIDAVREAIASRLHLVPRFRQVIHVPGRGRGGPLWVDAPRFDIRDHVVVRLLPPGTDETALLAVAEELRTQRLDPSRPLWRMWFMPGLPAGRVAMFVKLHHSIADGMAAMTMIAALLDAGPDPPITPASPWTPRLLHQIVNSSSTPPGGTSGRWGAPDRCSSGRGRRCGMPARPGPRSASSSPKSRQPERASTGWSVPAGASP
jgi:hypothetical protein